jgi:leucyl-tRNA synthetase
MACPAHDERDFAFAEKFDLPIVEVLEKPEDSDEVGIYHGEGVMVNSGAFDGMRSEQVREEIVDWLEQRGVGKTKVTYKMRDWLISRQRYWGAPIPIIHCDDHGAVAVPDDQLPVILPDVEDYKPTGAATSVLAGVTDWVDAPCPTCGKPGKRETDTMDGYACSSWYFLRYLDPFNDKQAWDPAVEAHWGPVDYYNGADHAVAHLLYSRFWMRFFYKLGLASTPEPFKRMMYNAYIMAPDGLKMSKSKGNVIDPLEIMNSGYGADALRVYEMFIAPYDLEAPWDTRGVPGTYRFLNRVWSLTQDYVERDAVELDQKAAHEILAVAHRTVKKVTDDIENDKFNTAVSSMMEAVNAYYKLKEKYPFGKNDQWKFAIESLLQVLSPFAPHITEELWHDLGYDTTIHIDTWPKWNDAYLQTSQVTIAVQVNGKLRATVQAAVDATEDEIKASALSEENVQKFIMGSDPKKIIYIKGKLINIVI